LKVLFQISSLHDARVHYEQQVNGPCCITSLLQLWSL